MKFKRYENANEFLNETEKFLMEREVENNLIIGISNNLKSGEFVPEGEPYFASIKENDEIILATLMTPPKSLVISCKENNKQVLRLLIEKLIEENIEIPGIIADKEVVKSFMIIYKEHHRCNFEKEMDMRIYKLTEINEVKKSKGFFRKANKNDLDIIAEWILENDGMWKSADTLEKAIKIARDKIENERVYLWIDHEPVSMAMKARESFNTAVISGVLTPIKLRGKGYATSCVVELSQLLLNSGYNYCSLFTDLSNPTSNSIYMNIGYEPVCDVDSYFIKKQ